MKPAPARKPRNAAKTATTKKTAATSAVTAAAADAAIPAPIREAQWIWPTDFRWDIYNGYAQFRKTFALPAVPRKAPLYITADESYQLYINGRYVCRGPARGYQSHWPYDEVDVSSYLQKGDNCIAVRAYNPGLSNFQYLHQGYAGFLLAAQWGKTRLHTDATWKARRQKGVSPNRVVTSLQLFQQEDIDLRVEDPAWLQPGYDDSHWDEMICTSVWNGMPWSSLEPRGMPMLSEEIVSEARIIGSAEGKNLPQSADSERNISLHRFEEGLAHQPFSGSIVEPLAVPKTAQDSYRSYLIDFGHTVVGSILLDIDGALGGEVVETFHTETIDEATLAPDYAPQAHCRMAFAHRLTCRAGSQTHDFYQTFGFRYMVLTVRGATAGLTLRTSLRTTLYPHAIRGSFSSSDAQLESIWQVCAWTQQVCSMDAYVDTPWREQAQWWGDARVQSWNTFHLSGDERLLRRGIGQIADMRTPAGITYGHAPTMAHNCVLPDFTLVWLATLWDLYRQSGETDTFLAQQKTVQDALAYFEQWTNPQTGLLDFDPRYWLFLDWTGLQKNGQPTLFTLWLLYALDCLHELYSATKNRQQAERMRQWATRVRASLRKLLQPSGLLSDGILPGGKVNPHCSVHAQTLALLTDLAPEHRETMLQKSLLPFVRGQSDDPVRPSAYWITYTYSALAQHGYGADVVAHIRKHWEPMVAHGTTWENWDPKRGHESFSHAWSAHPLFHLMQILGGVRASKPQWAAVSYEPTFIGEHAAIAIPSPRGIIRSAWQRKGDTVSATLELPTGVVAEARLPGQKKQKLAAGKHRFTVKLPQAK